MSQIRQYFYLAQQSFKFCDQVSNVRFDGNLYISIVPVEPASVYDSERTTINFIFC